MITKIKIQLGLLQPVRVRVSDQERLYRPERPINFVSRRDPSFYFMSSKR
jgi:hypothetical protein